MKIDFHIHTVYSDGVTTLRELEKQCRKLEIVPAITDHNRFFSGSLSIPFIRGEEVRTREGDLLAINITEEIPRGLSCEETLDLIREQGGISILAHPFDKTRKGCLNEKADAIELNARASKEDNRRAAEYARKHNLPLVADSDAHFPDEIGNAYTEGPDVDVENTKELLYFIHHGKPVVKRHVSLFERGVKRVIGKVFQRFLH
jgi:predicted metal-dependent phosphoesterase TrpH